MSGGPQVRGGVGGNVGDIVVGAMFCYALLALSLGLGIRVPGNGDGSGDDVIHLVCVLWLLLLDKFCAVDWVGVGFIWYGFHGRLLIGVLVLPGLSHSLVFPARPLLGFYLSVRSLGFGCVCLMN